MSSYNVGNRFLRRKNVGHGLQFDVNYTWSHSIDNVSVVANAPAIGGYGFICDVSRPRECRSSSDFDGSSYSNGNFIYDLPFGRRKDFAGSAARWLDQFIGGAAAAFPAYIAAIPRFEFYRRHQNFQTNLLLDAFALLFCAQMPGAFHGMAWVISL